jgi:hypothetical protein
MSLINVPVRIVLRNDTAANWSSNNPTLMSGEAGVENDTGKMKLGTGLTWNSTPYVTDAVAAAIATETSRAETEENSLHTEMITDEGLIHAITINSLGGIPYSYIGAHNGVASLDSTGNVPATQLANATAGGATIDTTATDIQPLGTRAAGAVGKASDAGHVHPITGVVPTTDTRYVGTVYRIPYNTTTSAYPARPAVSVIPAGYAEYVGPVAPTDSQAGDTWVDNS